MNLLIRADANPRLGTGHVMRCLALAQAWSQEAHGAVCFCAARPFPQALHDAVVRSGFEVEIMQGAPKPGSLEDLRELIRVADRMRAERVVIDHYDVDERYQLGLRERGLRFLMIDDYRSQSAFHADWVLNENLHATPAYYRGTTGRPSYLLGPEYSLLRREFTDRAPSAHRTPDIARRVLITVGGSDPHRATETIAAATAAVQRRDIEVLAVLGGAVEDPDGMQRRLGELGLGQRLTVRRTVHDMRAVMEWADIGITAAGSTTFEAMYLGLPCLLVVVADNQLPQAEAASRLGVAELLGWVHELREASLANKLERLCEDAQRRAEMSERAQALVDGRGGTRAARVLYRGQA